MAAEVAHGRSNPEIAAALGTGRRTVESHRTRIYATLELRSCSELLRRWLAAGLEGGA